MKQQSALIVIASALAFGATLIAGQQPSNEELPRRQFDSGMSFMQAGRYSEAIKDFQAIIDSFPRSQVADDALLQIGLYQLEIAHNVSATQTAVDQLLKVYPDSNSAPMAYVVSGRLAMDKGRTNADVDTALASFERVPRLFPGNDAVPAAGYYAGETLRQARRYDEALARYRRVTAEFPNSSWAALANLGAGYCLVQSERTSAALPEIQRVRQLLPNTAAAGEALNINTILYRLYVRAQGQPAFGFTGRFIGEERADFKDVAGVVVDSANRLLLGHKLGVAVFDPKAGGLRSTVGANEPSAFFVDERGRIIVARNGTLIAEKAESLTISIPLTEPGKTRVVEDIPAAVALASGMRLVADRKGKNVIRVGVDGRYIGPFTAVNAERLALNKLEDVGILEKDTKSITVTDRDGKLLSKIATKGTGYQFNEPVDLTFDQLGHLYVLDRGGSVIVFSPKYKLITTFSIPDKSAGAFTRAKAFALDPTGRMYIFDERAKRIQVYQ